VKASKLFHENKGFLLFLLLMVMFRSAIADWNDVPSGSMRPTIIEGDRIYVNKLAYDIRVPLTHISLKHLDEPHRGDVVIFDSKAADKRLVKRTIGLPGDVVQLQDNKLTINGVAAKYTDVEDHGDYVIATETLGGMQHRVRFEPYRSNPHRSFGPVTVPENSFLMLGDNRDNSADSRSTERNYIGFVPRQEIVGRSSHIVASLNPDHYYLPRADRWWEPMQSAQVSSEK
jgi:signal peptidase I